MKYLYAPWRSDYIDKDRKDESQDSKSCPFCFKKNDDKKKDEYLLYQSKHAFVMMNRFPYNAGHLMVIPYEHKKYLYDLSKEEQHDCIDLLSMSSEIVQKSLKAEGVNIGANIGKAAGGSIEGHLHFHVLPRWIGDTSFLPVLSETKQVSFDLKEIYKKLKKEF